MFPPPLPREALEALSNELGLHGVWVGRDGWVLSAHSPPPPPSLQYPLGRAITYEPELAALALDQGHSLSQPQQVVFCHQAWVLGHQV